MILVCCGILVLIHVHCFTTSVARVILIFICASVSEIFSTNIAITVFGVIVYTYACTLVTVVTNMCAFCCLVLVTHIILTTTVVTLVVLSVVLVFCLITICLTTSCTFCRCLTCCFSAGTSCLVLDMSTTFYCTLMIVLVVFGCPCGSHLVIANVAVCCITYRTYCLVLTICFSAGVVLHTVCYITSIVLTYAPVSCIVLIPLACEIVSLCCYHFVTASTYCCCYTVVVVCRCRCMCFSCSFIYRATSTLIPVMCYIGVGDCVAVLCYTDYSTAIITCCPMIRSILTCCGIAMCSVRGSKVKCISICVLNTVSCKRNNVNRAGISSPCKFSDSQCCLICICIVRVTGRIRIEGRLSVRNENVISRDKLVEKILYAVVTVVRKLNHIGLKIRSVHIAQEMAGVYLRVAKEEYCCGSIFEIIIICYLFGIFYINFYVTTSNMESRNRISIVTVNNVEGSVVLICHKDLYHKVCEVKLLACLNVQYVKFTDLSLNSLDNTLDVIALLHSHQAVCCGDAGDHVIQRYLIRISINKLLKSINVVSVHVCQVPSVDVDLIEFAICNTLKCLHCIVDCFGYGNFLIFNNVHTAVYNNEMSVFKQENVAHTNVTLLKTNHNHLGICYFFVRCRCVRSVCNYCSRHRDNSDARIVIAGIHCRVIVASLIEELLDIIISICILVGVLVVCNVESLVALLVESEEVVTDLACPYRFIAQCFGKLLYIRIICFLISRINVLQGVVIDVLTAHQGSFGSFVSSYPVSICNDLYKLFLGQSKACIDHFTQSVDSNLKCCIVPSEEVNVSVCINVDSSLVHLKTCCSSASCIVKDTNKYLLTSRSIRCLYNLSTIISCIVDAGVKCLCELDSSHKVA